MLEKAGIKLIIARE